MPRHPCKGKKCEPLTSDEKINIGRLTDTAISVSGSLTSLASHPQATIEFLHNRMQLLFSDDLLTGLVRSNYRVEGQLVEGKLSKLTFTGKLQGDLNQWFRDQVTSQLRNGQFSKPFIVFLNEEIKKMDFMAVTAGDLSGDFEEFFFKNMPVTVQITVRMFAKKDTSYITGKIPFYFDPAKNLTSFLAPNNGIHIIARKALTLIAENALKKGVAVLDNSIVGIDKLLGGGGQSGWLALQSKHGTQHCLSVDSKRKKVISAPCKESDYAQQWRFEGKALKSVIVRNKKTNKCWEVAKTKILGVWYNSIHNGASLQLKKCQETSKVALNQRFFIKPKDRKNNIVEFTPTSAILKCVDTNPKKPTKIHQWSCNGKKHQLFKIDIQNLAK